MFGFNIFILFAVICMGWGLFSICTGIRFRTGAFWGGNGCRSVCPLVLSCFQADDSGGIKKENQLLDSLS